MQTDGACRGPPIEPFRIVGGSMAPVNADAGFPLLFNGIAGECMHAGAGPLPLPL